MQALIVLVQIMYLLEMLVEQIQAQQCDDNVFRHVNLIRMKKAPYKLYISSDGNDLITGDFALGN